MKSSNVGSIVLATDQGLGYLAKSFYDNGIITKVSIRPHSSRPSHLEWYGADAVDVDTLLDSCGTLIFFEEVFDWKIIVRARERGIKTILMPMYECTRSPFPYQPDLIVNPSELDQQYYPDGIRCTVPVEATWRLRSRAEVFVHNAGNGGLGGRNGTKELIEAMKNVQSPIKLIIRSQVPMKIPDDARIEVRVGQFDDIWSEGDVFVFPEKFNGLSLPLQEAYASGMLVMAGNRFPINTWLPKEPLIPVAGYHKERIAVPFDCADYNPQTIAETIDKYYNTDITHYSLMGKEWGGANSWGNLKDFYKEICTEKK